VPSRNVEIFAEQLVRFVRDQAIHDCTMRLRPNAKSPEAKHWVSIIGQDSLDAVRDVIIPDCVDEALFFLLNAIDKEDLKLLFVAPDGQIVDLNDEGLWEMAGSYIEEDEEGWRLRFSKEKVVKYLK